MGMIEMLAFIVIGYLVVGFFLLKKLEKTKKEVRE